VGASRLRVKEYSYTSTPLWAFVACSRVNFVKGSYTYCVVFTHTVLCLHILCCVYTYACTEWVKIWQLNIPLCYFYCKRNRTSLKQILLLQSALQLLVGFGLLYDFVPQSSMFTLLSPVSRFHLL